MAFIDPDDEPKKAKFHDPDERRAFTDRLKAVGGAAVQGLATGGPAGLVARTSAEAMKQGGEMSERAGYDVGGAVTDASAKVLPAEAAAGAGFVANVATQAVPAVLGGELAKAAASPVLQAGAKRLMQAALKPTWESLRKGQAVQAIDTMLEEGIPVTKGGLAKLQSQVGKLNDQVDAAIAGSNATVNKGAAGSALLDTWTQFKNQVNPQSDLEAIKQAWMKFRNHPDLAGKTDITVQKAQELKRGTYRALDKKAYGEVQGADQEAQKAIARGLKEEISKAVPEVGPLNARESKLLNAEDILARRVLMSQNNNMLGLTPLSPNPLSWLLFLTDRSPWATSQLARLMHSGSGQIPATAGRVGGGLYGAGHVGGSDVEARIRGILSRDE